jgi:hypothetical protein
VDSRSMADSPRSATPNSTASSTTRTALWAEKARRNPDDPYAWAMAHRTVAGEALTHLPALADIVRDDHPFVAIQKSAQVGVSELLVNFALWAADTRYAGRGNVLVLMPTQNQMDDFTQGRIDKATQDSAYLRSRLQPEPPRRKGADRTRLKRIGDGAIYLRGSESRRQVASVDADVVILDEFDQMDEGVLELARKRLSSSRRGRFIVASTPGIPEAGINGLLLQSDQRRYLLPCPGCGLEQDLRWPENIDMDRACVACRSCRALMDVLASGRWVPQAPGNDRIHGYYLNRLYSPWANIPEMIEASRATTPFAVQEFQNSDLGETFVPPGGGISVDVVDRCRRDYALSDYAGQPCDMGIDVGLRCHVVIRERRKSVEREGSLPFVPRLWFAGDVAFAELDGLVQRFNVQSIVIDAYPDLHAASEFVLRHRPRAWLAQYDRQQPEHERERGRTGGPNRYHINRTQALDEVFQRFRDEAVELPREARELGGMVKQGLGAYYRQLLAPKRTLEVDGQGNWQARWVDARKDDHYAHAELYTMLAGAANASFTFVAVMRGWRGL